jgi:hypothetical protein
VGRLSRRGRFSHLGRNTGIWREDTKNNPKHVTVLNAKTQKRGVFLLRLMCGETPAVKQNSLFCQPI